MVDPHKDIRALGTTLTELQKLILSYVRWRATRPRPEWELITEHPRITKAVLSQPHPTWWSDIVDPLPALGLATYTYTEGDSQQYLTPTPLSDLLEEMGIIEPWEPEQGD